MQPRNADPITFLQMRDATSQRDHDASAFVARSERQGWLYGPITISRVQIGMAHPTCDDFYQCLPRSWLGNGNFSDDQGLAELFDNRSLHTLLNCHPPPS
jgi:hypothetical protein